MTMPAQLSLSPERARLLLLAEWLADHHKRAESNLEQALSTITNLVPLQPEHLPSRAWFDEAHAEQHHGPAEVWLQGDSMSAWLTMPLRPLGLPLWFPARLQLSLPMAWGGAESAEAANLLSELSQALDCAYAAIVSRRNTVLFPAAQLDEMGTPFVGWQTILSRQEFGDPPTGVALDARRWLLEIPPPWDFDNRVSRERYDAAREQLEPWMQEATPSSLDLETKAYLRKSQDAHNEERE